MLRSMKERCHDVVRWSCVVLLLAALASAAWPTGAFAGEWLFGPFGAGVPDNYGVDPGLAMDASGEAALIFCFNGVTVSLRPASGTFEDPEWGGVRVSAQGVEGSTPAVAINARGDVVAVWQQNTRAHPQIYEAIKPAHGSFEAPQAVSPEDEEASSPSVAINNHGEATVVWLSNNGDNHVIMMASASVGGKFSTPVTLTDSDTNASHPQVLASQAGKTILDWLRTDTPNPTLELAVHPPEGSFPAPDPAGNDQNVGEVAAPAAPRLVINSDGEALAVWRDPAGQVQSTRLPVEADVFDPVSTLDSSTGLPSGAINEHGEAVVAWPSGQRVQVVTAAPRASFGAAVELPSYFAPVAAQITIGASGATAVEWEGTYERSPGHEGSSRPPGGTFAKPKGEYGGNPPLEGSLATASDSAGDMIGVFTSTSLNDMGSFGYDAGPLLYGVSVPAGGQVGQSLSFSMSEPLSVWRPIRSVTWSFGDGTEASGLSVSHAYSQPGAYQVTATASDTQNIFGGFPEQEYVSNSATQTIIIAATPSSTTPVAEAAKQATDSLSGLRISPSAFLARSGGPTISVASGHESHPTGAAVRFTLTLAGTVTFTIEQQALGTKHRGKCLPQRTVATRSHSHSCVLEHSLGSFTRPSAQGANSFHFTGRIDNRKLPPGKYALLAGPEVAHQATQTAAFRILTH
jgi:hypothetical protein